MSNCPYCQATTRQIKAGKTKAGIERYRCLHCNRKYTPEMERTDVDNVSEQTLVKQSYLPAAAVLLPATTTRPIQEFPPAVSPGDVQAAKPAAATFPVEGHRGWLSRVMDWTSTTNGWGRFPEFTILQSAILLLLALTFVARRAAADSSQLLSWIGLALLILPIAFRLASATPARRERIGLVLILGMSLYLVKVMYSPMAFTFPDELSHLRNVNEILLTHRLFQENPVQPVTAFYPGLPIVTSSLASLGGLSPFLAGLLVIGTARLILFLALFLLFEQVSGSARVAGLAVLLYMANPNFLYWTAEYAYEPLALPLIVLVLLAVAKRETAIDRRQHLAWTVVAMLGLLTVVITHHMSSYILTGLLIVLVALYAIRSRGAQWGPWDLALVALGMTSFWLVFAANFTITYLSPVLLGAVRSLFGLIVEEQKGRELFKSGSTGRAAALWEQLVAMGSVIFVALGLPFGVFEIWQKHRDKVFALLLAGIALLYLPMQMLRFTKAGWETANRSSEFLFIGIGFVLALGILEYGLLRWPGWKSQTVLAFLVVTLVFGGLIAGWPPRARWPRPYVLSTTNSHLVKPQVVSAAEWVLANLGPDNRIAASKADAKMLGAYDQYPFTDTASSIKEMFLSPDVGTSERHTLSKRDIEYIVTDRKMISWDHMIGYFFYNQQYGSSSELQLVEPQIFGKFDKLEGVNRMMDAGDIVLYDVQSYLSSFKEENKTTTTGRVP